MTQSVDRGDRRRVSIDFNVGWLEVIGEDTEGCECGGGCSWEVSEGIAKLLETCCGEVRGLPSNPSKGSSLRHIGNVCSKWCKTVTNVASVVSHPGPIACGNLQRRCYEVQAHVEKAVF